MLIHSLELNNFRNYKKQFFIFDPFINIFIGKNAQGKTNVLESLYLLSLSKSFKTNILEEMILFGEEYSTIKGKVLSGNHDLEMKVVLSTQGKKAFINNKDIIRSSEYVGYLNVILFTPEDLMLIKGSPRLRRKLIDTEISKISPIYLYNLNKYMNLLKERNKYLKLLQTQRKGKDDYLEVLTEQMVSLQIDLIKKRYEFVSLLNEITQTMYHYISNEEEILDISYSCGFKDISYEGILNKYQKNYQRDIIYGNTGDGIHKDDLNITLNHQSAYMFASQGQQRSIVLSIKIALLEIVKKEIGEYPILLLDDVLSELDDLRKTKLLNLIEHKVQTFVTTTSIDGIHHQVVESAKKIEIENGNVKGEL